jgi:hypothetical protein
VAMCLTGADSRFTVPGEPEFPAAFDGGRPACDGPVVVIPPIASSFAMRDSRESMFSESYPKSSYEQN